MNYWDSCAILPICVNDDAFSGLAKSIAAEDDGIVTWWGTPVECCSAFARLRRQGIFTYDDEQQSRTRLSIISGVWNEVEPSEAVRALARQLLLRQPLRAADSLQLAAAIVWADGDIEGRGFVSLDKRLRDAAQAEGFTVIPNMIDFLNATNNLTP